MMKVSLLKLRIQTCYLCGGLLALAVNFFLASASLSQADDTRIAFYSNRSDGRNSEIYLMNSDGKRVRRLTRHPQYDGVPAWSPNGQKITFISDRDQHDWEIYVMNPDDANPINLTQSPGRRDRASSWSPDGEQIVFSSVGRNRDGGRHSDIWVMDADGGNRRNLTNDNAGDLSPDWSPDGMQIVFHSDRNKDWEFEHPVLVNMDIYVMNADGTGHINLTNHPAVDRNPDYSPDGQQIVFYSNRDGNREVYVMNADGTNPINLTNHLADDRHPDWSPDGRRIAFTSNRDGDWEKEPNDNWEVFVMDADGANPINLTNHKAWDTGPAWGPAPTLSVTSKKRLATLWGKVKHTQ